MSPVPHLISKLNEQFSHNAEPGQLLLTVKQLEAALVQLDPQTGNSLGTAKIAVLLPRPPIHFNKDKKGDRPIAPLHAVKEEPQQLLAIEEEQAPEPEYNAQDHFDPLAEVPTLAKQKPREINEQIAVIQSSLNDALKVEATEVGHVLKDAPVRDLKKAIGINERFVFIQDLFRGDEIMYERCIKTINNFRIYAEAEYWIERELNVKLGWDKKSDAAQQFYRLVKRRFS